MHIDFEFTLKNKHVQDFKIYFVQIQFVIQVNTYLFINHLLFILILIFQPLKMRLINVVLLLIALELLTSFLHALTL